MVSASERRILVWLNGFDESLEEAWDVPRELSLPGVAEGIGVVRSALHKPMKRLVEGELVRTRQAHVLGGGGRKRTVHHISMEGRALSSEAVESSSRARGAIIGDAPRPAVLVGREDSLSAVEAAREKSGVIWVSGIPGIGKTALLRSIAEEEIERGGVVRWCSASPLMGTADIAETWLGSGGLRDDVGVLAGLIVSEASSDLLMLDDLHLLSSRFFADAVELIDTLAEGGCTVIAAYRPPLEGFDAVPISLSGLDTEAARSLLDGFDESIAEALITHLDGHPLALSMVSRKASLESAREGLETFLKQEILDPLPENARAAVDELAIQPEPVEATSLAHQNELGLLDEHALLRNLDGLKIGLQHLVANLRLEQMSSEQRRLAHLQAVKRLSAHDSEGSMLHIFYHRLMADDEGLEEWMNERGGRLVRLHPAAVAGLLNESDRSSLDWYAALAECELGDAKRAFALLSTAIDSGEVDSEEMRVEVLRSRLHLLSGREQEAEDCRTAAIDSADGIERVRMLASEASRRLDDRLPQQPPASDCLRPLDSIQLGGLDLDEKRDALAAIACIRHAHALIDDDQEAASAIREELAGVFSHSPMLEDLHWRAAIAAGEEPAFEAQDPLSRIGALAWRLEHADEADVPSLVDDLEDSLSNWNDRSERPAGRRAEALGWTWRGIVHQSIRMPAWSQAINCWRSAECPRAAKSIEGRLHAWLADTGRS